MSTKKKKKKISINAIRKNVNRRFQVTALLISVLYSKTKITTAKVVHLEKEVQELKKELLSQKLKATPTVERKFHQYMRDCTLVILFIAVNIIAFHLIHQSNA